MTQDSGPIPPVPGSEFDRLAAMPPVARARFTCAVHGTEAGVVALHGDEAAGWLVIMESPICSLHGKVQTPRAQALRDALATGDARRIHALDEEWAPFFCPVCGTSYCGACWRTYLVFDPELPGWLEEQRGICPEGHERMLSD